MKSNILSKGRERRTKNRNHLSHRIFGQSKHLADGP